MSEGIQTVLIVDDDMEILSLLRAELGQEFNILSAQNGEEGLVMALLHRPDMIVSDIQMPELNGWDFCFILRQIPSTKSIPFIFLSKLKDLPEKIRALRVGADDFISKPFSLGEITHRIKAVSDRLRTRRKFLDGQTIFGSEMNTLLIDLLEFLRATRRSGYVEYSRVHERGRITMCKGNIVRAILDQISGEEAIKRLLVSGPGEVWFVEKDVPDTPPIIEWSKLVSNYLA